MTQIFHYTVRFWGGSGTPDDDKVRASIYLFDGNNHLKGRLDFKPAELCGPDQNGSMISMELPENLMNSVLLTLQEEKPVHLYWQAKAGSAFFGTGQEPVSENEPIGF